MILHWGNYTLVGEVVPYHCGAGEEGIFKIMCSCPALLICIWNILFMAPRIKLIVVFSLWKDFFETKRRIRFKEIAPK